jgi:hypothetical protein
MKKRRQEAIPDGAYFDFDLEVWGSVIRCLLFLDGFDFQSDLLKFSHTQAIIIRLPPRSNADYGARLLNENAVRRLFLTARASI